MISLKKFLLLCMLSCMGSLHAKVNMSFEYNEIVNAYYILDNIAPLTYSEESIKAQISGLNPEYLVYWPKDIIFTDNDKKLFAQYSALRKKYLQMQQENADSNAAFILPKQHYFVQHGVFAKFIFSGPFAKLFYNAKNMDEVYKRAGQYFTLEEQKFIKEFYDHFIPKLKTILAESDSFIKYAEALNAHHQDPRLNMYTQKLESFFGREYNLDYRVYLIWWPPIQTESAQAHPDALFLLKNPKQHIKLDAESIVGDLSVAFHELAHAMSDRVDAQEKVARSKPFIQNCQALPIDNVLRLFEEPLAVTLGQMYFIEKFYPGYYNYAIDWYNDPWITQFARVLYPVVNEYLTQDKSIDESFMQKAGILCRDHFKSVAGFTLEDEG